MDKESILELQNIDLNDVTQGRKRGIEENIKNKIVIRLLELLGYDKIKDMDFEHIIRNKKADILIMSKGEPKIIVECKSIEQDLDKHIEQALGYAYRKQIGYVILTKGIEIRLYRSFIENVIDPRDRLLLTIELKNLSRDFTKLSKWISRRSVSEKYLDKITEEKEREIVESVTEPQLVENLRNAKQILTIKVIPKIKVKFKTDGRFRKIVEDWCANSNFDVNNEEFWINKLAKEVAYSFINKLYFYRIAEDKGIVKPKLTKKALEKLKDSFEYNELCDLAFKEILKIDYRAIFEHSLFDKVELDVIVIKKIVDELSKYNFDNIDSDILGKIYEHHIDSRERKELGQFYTPKKIINYILNRVSITPKKKILDPACGSGGFLINAYDRLKRQYVKGGLSESSAHNKILKENLFGIDINPFAVQLTAMNLALRNLEGKTDEINIVPQDSLLFGLNSWIAISHNDLDNNHKQRFIEGTIPNKVDIVVGNPPYVRIRNIRKEKLKAYQEFLDTAKHRFDLFSLFIERGIKFLNKKGRLGFIVSNTLLSNDVLSIIRKYILDTCLIEEIVDLGAGIFEEANVSTLVIILKKEEDEKKREKNIIKIVTDINEMGKVTKSHKIKQKIFLENSLYKFDITKKSGSEDVIIKRIDENSIKLYDIVEPSCGIQIWKDKEDKEKSPYYLSKTRENEKYKKLIEGKDIELFNFKFNNQYVLYEPTLLERAREERFFTAKEKIVMRYIGRKLIGAFDNEQYYTQKSVLCLIPKNNKFDLRYILAIINSRLMNWYYLKLMGKNIYPRINLSYLNNLPIKDINRTEQNKIISKVDKIIAINKKLNQNKDGSLIKERDKIIREINKDIYNIYGINDKEKKIIDKLK